MPLFVPTIRPEPVNSGLQHQGLARQLPRRAPTLAEREGGLLSTVGSGLGMVGPLLDVPGGMVRNALGGGDPLAPLQHPLSQEGRISGRELLEKGGLLRPHQPGLDFGDVLGFGAEVLLDPLTAIAGLGFAKALGKGGQALRKAGLLEDVQKASGLGPREFLASRNLSDVLPSLQPAQRESLEAAARPLGGIDTLGGQPLGGQLGFGLPFREPAVTVGTPGVGRALDTLGEGLTALPPVRLASAALDYRTKGRVGKAEQQFSRAVTRETEKQLPLAKLASTQTNRTLRELYEQFSEQFGGELFKQADDIDPRLLDELTNQVFDERMAEWQYGAADRAFRQKYFHLLKRAVGDVDPDSIHPRFDEIVDEYRDATGRTDATADDVLDVLKQSDPRPTRASVTPEARMRAGDATLKGAEEAPPWKQGDVVLAADRDNYGWVQRVGPRTSEVLFKNPETGVVAVKQLNNDLLTKAFDAGSDDAAYWSQLATAKTFSDILRHVGETGNVNEAFAYFAADIGSRVSPEFAKKMRGTVTEVRGAQNAVWDGVEAMGGRAKWLDREHGSLIDHLHRTLPATGREAGRSAGTDNPCDQPGQRG